MTAMGSKLPRTRWGDLFDTGDCPDTAISAAYRVKQPNNDNNKTKPGKDRTKKDPSFDVVNIVLPFISVFLYCADIVTDVILAIAYFDDESWNYFGWTIGFVIGPSLITCVIGLWLYAIQYSEETKECREDGKPVTSKWLWFLRLFMTVLQIGPILRYIEHLYHGCRSRNRKLEHKEKDHHLKLSNYENVDVTMLRLFEGFLESAPQLVLQLCILMIEKPSIGDISTMSKTTVSMLMSWLSLAWFLLVYHKSLRRSLDTKETMEIKAMLVYYLNRLFEIGPRVLVLAFFASCFKYWVFAIIAIHWSVMWAWLLCQRTTFCDFCPKNLKRYVEFFFNIICALILVFCFLNVREGHTRYRMSLYYLLFYVENFVLVLVWYHETPDTGLWFHTTGLLITVCSAVAHILLTLFYYTCCHPTNDIKLCLTGKEKNCFESVCWSPKERSDKLSTNKSDEQTCDEEVSSRTERTHL